MLFHRALKFDTAASKDRIALAVGLLGALNLRFIGTFSLSEIIALCAIPFIGCGYYGNRNVRTLIILLILWNAGTVIAGYYNDIPLLQAIRGFGNLTLFVLVIPFAYWLLADRIPRILYYCAGYGISQIVQWAIWAENYDNSFITGYWLTKYLAGICCFICYLLYFKGKREISYLFIEGYAIYALLNNSRLHFLMINIGIILLISADYFRRESSRKKMQAAFNRHIFLIGIAMATAGYCSYIIYGEVASWGFMGNYGKHKYEHQSTSPMGIAAGRGDFFCSVIAIKNNPVIGYGYNAEENDRYPCFTSSEWLYWKNFRLRYSGGSLDRIPTHSYILGSWIQGGILGLLFWLFVICKILQFYLTSLYRHPKLLGYFTISTSLMVWDIFFSPLGNRMAFTMIFMPMLLSIGNTQDHIGLRRICPAKYNMAL